MILICDIIRKAIFIVLCIFLQGICPVIAEEEIL